MFSLYGFEVVCELPAVAIVDRKVATMNGFVKECVSNYTNFQMYHQQEFH